MKKVLMTLLILVAIAGVGCSIYFGIQYANTSKEKSALITQNQSLQSTVDAIGALTTAYTVNANVYAGKTIQEADLVQKTAQYTEGVITNKSDLVGKIYKVNIKKGTTLTEDLVYTDEEKSYIYERDMTFDYLPLGLEVEDYVDIRIVLPYGEEFIVMNRKRVHAITDNTIKLKLDEAELALWTSALTDESIYKTKGLKLYVTKYVDPGITATVIPFYPVRTEMESIVTLNPNIIDKTKCINKNIRDNIESMLAKVTDQDGSKVSTGVSEEASSINQAKEYYVNEASKNGTGSTNSGNKASTNGSLQQVGDSVNLNTIE